LYQFNPHVPVALSLLRQAPAGPPRLLLLCGLPGSGKSSLARSFAASSWAKIVTDEPMGKSWGIYH
jgi:chloramphenicol 3-O-phosphotransferase